MLVRQLLLSLQLEQGPAEHGLKVLGLEQAQALELGLKQSHGVLIPRLLVV